MASSPRISRRALLTRGGGAAGLAALGGLAGLAPRAAAQEEPRREERPNVLLVVLDGLRADAVGAYDDVFDDRETNTPNLDDFADEAIRFRYATPDAMPAIPVRRALLTGRRSYPFRDWVATAGVPAIPGWGKVHDWQLLVPQLLKADGVETIWVTDNPTLTGPRFNFVRRTGPLPRSNSYRPDERAYFLPLGGPVQQERVEPSQRVLRAGLEQIRALRGRRPWFLALDAFNPVDAFEMPRQYVRWRGPIPNDVTLPVNHTYVDQIRVDIDDATVDRVRELYAAEVTAVDAALGRVLNALDDAGHADDTAVIVLGDYGVALGEQGVFGQPSGVWHRRVYQVPLMIRDPRRRWAGDTSSWFVTTHDIPRTILSYMRLPIPGRVSGEDLTTLFDDDDLPGRPYFTTAIDSHVVVGDREWLLVGRTDQDRWRLYKMDDEDEPDELRAETDISPTVLEKLRAYALTAAGGTLPLFGDTSSIRPPQPRELNKRVADDGTLDEDEQEANELRG